MSEQLVIVDTHPSQHHAAVYRLLAREGLDPLVCFGSDFSVRRARSGLNGGRELVTGYRHHFLANSDDGADAIEYAGTGDLAIRLRGAGAALIMTASGAFSRAAFRLCQSARVPVLLRVDAVPAPRGARWRRALHDVKLRRTYARCARLLYSGVAARERLLGLGAKSDRVVCVPPALDAAVYRATESDRQSLRERARADVGVDDRTILLLFSGALTERKSPMLLIEALSQLQNAPEQFAVLFNGDGPLRAALQRAASQANVRAVFPQTRSGGGQSAFHHAADLFVLPSSFEPWGLAVNEALLHGVPVVVSDGVGCHRDLVLAGKTGETFPSGSADALAAALLKAQPLARRSEIRTACRDRIEPYSAAAAASAIVRAVTAVQSEIAAPAGR